MKSWIVGTVIGIVFLFGIGAFTYGAVVLSRGSADEIVGDLDFAWSPDGIRIAFTSDRNGKRRGPCRGSEYWRGDESHQQRGPG